ncbi:MAG: triphosphoribosyl-dephospho-CoA synthase [Methylocystaceae bacterium]|nr:MAG: triphosphoribosyl-dephospho-CoA synthase [Methylocystaceae bacterium]
MADARPPGAAVERAFIAACEDELAAPKPGNVHLFAPGHGMEAKDFIDSAHAAAAHIGSPNARVGRRILDAVEASFTRVGCNTNLGIILLCAPVAHAALQRTSNSLREKLVVTLDGLDRCDADLAFRAISRASPGGLGAAPQHDVSRPAQIDLKQAMAHAADRDRIAFQYVSGFEDVFVTGLEAVRRARSRHYEKSMTTLHVFMSFASTFPDSHILRKFNAATAESVRRRAREVLSRLETTDNKESAFSIALELDRSLKSEGLNPGTSADLTVATLFVDYLLPILPNVDKNG